MDDNLNCCDVVNCSLPIQSWSLELTFHIRFLQYCLFQCQKSEFPFTSSTSFGCFLVLTKYKLSYYTFVRFPHCFYFLSFFPISPTFFFTRNQTEIGITLTAHHLLGQFVVAQNFVFDKNHISLSYILSLLLHVLMHTHTHTHTHTQTHTHTHTHFCPQTHPYKHSPLHTFKHTHT